MERLLFFGDWMSDSMELSDKRVSIVCVDVRFFDAIGQAGQHRQPKCPILRTYWTPPTKNRVQPKKLPHQHETAFSFYSSTFIITNTLPQPHNDQTRKATSSRRT